MTKPRPLFRVAGLGSSGNSPRGHSRGQLCPGPSAFTVEQWWWQGWGPQLCEDLGGPQTPQHSPTVFSVGTCWPLCVATIPQSRFSTPFSGPPDSCGPPHPSSEACCDAGETLLPPESGRDQPCCSPCSVSAEFLQRLIPSGFPGS